MAERTTRLRPTIDVIIPAFNASSHIAECLRSVHAQSGPFHLEVTVVDDGSSDGTAEVGALERATRVLRQPNRGPAAARNAGIAASNGEYIAFLDADDLWPVGSLAARLDVLTRHSEAALVFADCRQFDAAGPRAQTLFEEAELGARAWGGGGLVPDAYDRLLEENFITTGSVIIRRDILLAVGGFAEDLRLVEDLDLWLRVARDHPIAWHAEVGLLRRRHRLNTSRDAEAMSRAYLTVLERQSRSDTPATKPTLQRRLASLQSAELLHLARLSARRRDMTSAKVRSREALSVKWSCRAAAEFTWAWLMCLKDGRNGVTCRRVDDAPARSVSTVDFDGDLYNVVELCQRLGLASAGTSIETVVARALDAWGDEGLLQLDGVFTLAAKCGEHWWLYRDPSGMRPLYWELATNGQPRFASRLMALAHGTGSGPRLARSSLHEYLRCLDIAAPRTLLEDVHALEPGELLITDTVGKRSWTQQPSSSPGPGEPATDSTGAANALDVALRRSVHKRLAGASRPAAFLSGGIDSALICAMARQLTPEVTALTVGFDGARFDEAPVAARIAGHLGIAHRVLRFSRADYLDAFERLARGMDQPMADPATMASLLAFDHCREHFDAVLDGTGADEAVGAMPPRHVRLAVGVGSLVPSGMRRALVRRMSQIPSLAGYTPILDFEHPADTLIRWNGFTRKEIEELCDAPVSLTDTQFYRTFRRFPRRAHYERYSALLNAMPCDRLTQASQLSGACVRYPFCDPAVDRLLRQLPTEWRYLPGQPKRILRTLLARYVPREIWDVPKHGFDFPLHDFLSGDGFALVRCHVLEGRWLSRGLLQADRVRRYAQRYMAGEQQLMFRVWALTVLGAWLDEHEDLT